MAHPRLLAGTGDADPADPTDPVEAPDHDDPIGDLHEWRPPAGRPWNLHLAQLAALVPAGALRAALAGVAALVVMGGGWWLLRPPPPPVETALPLAEATSAGGSGAVPSAPGPAVGPGGAGADAPGAAAGAPVPADAPGEPGEIVVQAAGAVGRPGVYRLATDSRVDDLVRAAGGLQPDADADRVNLAAPVQDGERIWIPRTGDEEVPEVVAGSGGGGQPAGPGTAGSGSEAGPVDLNTASAPELETLPGIGPATAAAILAHRDQIGTFGSVDELIDVRGIGEAKLEQLRPLVTV